MSVPARRIDTPTPRRASTPVPARRTTTRAAPVGRQATRAGSRRAKKRKSAVHVGFALFSSFVVVTLVVGVVALNAFLAQTSFQAAAMQTQLSTLSDRYRRLTDEAARLSSPSRVASWAEQHHMVVPKDPAVILRVAGTGGPGGTASTGVPGARLGGLALAVKPILGESG